MEFFYQPHISESANYLEKKEPFHSNITLGPSRLRTETAGIVAGHTLSLINNYKPL